MLVGYVQDGKAIFPKVSKEGVCVPLFFLLEELLKRFNAKEDSRNRDEVLSLQTE
jgi:hypothetical protein